MSALESENRKIIGALVHDVAIWIGVNEQTVLSRWAIKTAMVLEALAVKDRSMFYKKIERKRLRLGPSFPRYTHVWIGRFSGSSLLVQGTDLWVDIGEGIPKVSNGYVSTVVVGHLAIQVHTFRIPRKYNEVSVQTNPGPWDRLLLQVSPTMGTVGWPPDLSFSATGAIPIDLLRRRWKTGREV